ncbi:hypothetical protein HS125_08790 [bacterium]|nr:hypothetical protein [bacterium]
MENFGPVLFVLFIVLVIVLAVYSSIAAARRKKELAAWAAAHQWTFSSGRDAGFDNRFPNFPPLQQGSNRYAYNVMSGPWRDRRSFAFDYHYETHSTDSKGRRQTHHHHFSAVIVGSDLPLKPLKLRPESFFDKIAEFVGWDDIDFESAEFSRKFHVTCPDRRWAYDVLHARTMEFLLSLPPHTVIFDTRWVYAARSGTWNVAQFETALDLVAGILDRFPDYLVRQLKGEN